MDTLTLEDYENEMFNLDQFGGGNSTNNSIDLVLNTPVNASENEGNVVPVEGTGDVGEAGDVGEEEETMPVQNLTTEGEHLAVDEGSKEDVPEMVLEDDDSDDEEDLGSASLDITESEGEDEDKKPSEEGEVEAKKPSEEGVVERELAENPPKEGEGEAEAVEAEAGVVERELTEEENEAAGEFIVNDEDFLLLEGDIDITITEEIAIPEYKIIPAETEQETDLLNELIKIIPEKYRENKAALKDAKNKLYHYINLKKIHSILNENNEPYKPKILGEHYKPLLECYLNNNFSNNFLIPIINAKKYIYQFGYENNKLKAIFEPLMSEDIDRETNVLLENVNKIKRQTGIRNKYRKTDARRNYSYKNELLETYVSINDIAHKLDDDLGYKSINKNDTLTYANIFNISKNATKNGYNNVSYNKQIIIGDTVFNIFDNIPVPGDITNKIGFIKPDDNYLAKTVYLKDTLLEVSNDRFNIEYNIPLDEENNIEIVDFTYSVGDSIKLCFYHETKSFEMLGNITEITKKHFIVKPKDTENLKDTQYKSLKIRKNDKNVIISKSEDLKKTRADNNRSCHSTETLVYKFPDQNITHENYRTILNDILPNNKDLINNNLTEFNDIHNTKQINTVLGKYSVSTEDLTFDTFKILADILNKNNTTLEKGSLYSQFNTIIKNLKEPFYKGFIKLLNRRTLDKFKPYYNNYPYYNTYIDSLPLRLEWINNTYDNGALFYVTLIRDSYSKLFKNAELTVKNIIGKIQQHNTHLSTLEAKIYAEKVKYASKDDCISLIEKRIVKIYNSITDFENDNGTQGVQIDEDKLLITDKNNIVQIDHYCILDIEDGSESKKLFKRVIIDSLPMWILEESLSVDTILNNNRNFCNLQGKNLQTIESSLLSKENACKYSEEQHECINKVLFNLIIEANELDKKIKDKRRILAFLENRRDFSEYLQDTQEILELTLKNHIQYQEDAYLIREKEYTKFVRKEVPEEYAILYTKIDKYLEKISKLPDGDYYSLLEILLNRYGREAYADENKLNIYCKVGTKVIVCKHHTLMIDFFKKPDESKTILEFIKNEYGIEDVGTIYCKNCGNEIYLGEYEEVEGYTESGAHIMTNERLDTEEGGAGGESEEARAKDPSKKRTVSVNLASINKYLEEGDNIDILTDENALNIIKSANALLKLMGITFNSAIDKKLLVKRTFELNNITIQSKSNWLNSQKRIPKKQEVIDKAYNVYRLSNELLNMATHLFIILQTAIPTYKVMKPHKRCKISLRGYPLDIIVGDDMNVTDNDLSGIEYLSCLLETLRDSTSSTWTSLKYKKLNIKDTLVKSVEIAITDKFIENSYNDKRKYLADLDIPDNTPTQNVWHEFKPPLDRLIINIDNFLPIPYKNYNDFMTHNTMLALSTIERIDTSINNAYIENQVYHPTPLGNTCCLDTINNDFNYHNYFNQVDIYEINTLLDSLSVMKQNMQYYDNVNLLFKYPAHPDRFMSFQNDVFPIEESDITMSIIRQLHFTFITSGTYIGKKHLYDENNICMYTGDMRSSLEKNEYMNADYHTLWKNINNSKTFRANIGIPNSGLIENLKKFIVKNSIQSNNVYFIKFVRSIENAIKTDNHDILNNLYTDLESQITIEIGRIIDKLDSYIHIKDAPNVRLQLENLGNLNNIHNEEISSGIEGLDRSTVIDNEMETNQRHYISRINLIKKFTKHTLQLIFHLKSNSTFTDEETITESIEASFNSPDRWFNAIPQSYRDNLIELLLKKNNTLQTIKNKLTGDTGSLFTRIYNTFKNSLSNLNLINGKPHIYDCNGSMKYYSELTYYNSSIIIHYLYLNTLNRLLSDLESAPPVGVHSAETVEIPLETQSTFTDERVHEIGAIFEGTVGSVDDELSGEAEHLGMIPISFETILEENNKNTAHFIYQLITAISKERDFFDKFSKKSIQQIIDKKTDMEKEENLQFMEELNTEARQGFKAMLKLGLETWKTISNQNKDLYLEREINEDVDDIEMDETERDEINRNLAENELGEYTEEEYQEWLANRNRNINEDAMAYEQGDRVLDDDGDAEMDEMDLYNF